jgi:hypothetical protein
MRLSVREWKEVPMPLPRSALWIAALVALVVIVVVALVYGGSGGGGTGY